MPIINYPHLFPLSSINPNPLFLFLKQRSWGRVIDKMINNHCVSIESNEIVHGATRVITHSIPCENSLAEDEVSGPSTARSVAI